MKTALVTGGNRGIGLAIASGLAQFPDMKVLLGSRDLTEGKAAAANIKGDVAVVELDLTERDRLAKQYHSIADTHGAPDILINNAAIYEPLGLLEISDEKIDALFRINVLAPADLFRLAAPAMIERGYGRIVNVSTQAGSFGTEMDGVATMCPVYCMSKSALNSLTLAASKALPDNVKINSMCPGWTRTRMGGPDADRSPEEGADTAIWLATLPDDGPSGGFFRDRKPTLW